MLIECRQSKLHIVVALPPRPTSKLKLHHIKMLDRGRLRPTDIPRIHLMVVLWAPGVSGFRNLLYNHSKAGAIPKPVFPLTA